MASVRIDSGEFPLLRRINMGHQPSRSKVVSAWIKSFEETIPQALVSFPDVIEDIIKFPIIWQERECKSAEDFIERYLGLSGLNFEEPARLVKALRGELGKKAKEEVLKGLKLKRHEQTLELASTVQPVAAHGGEREQADNCEIVSLPPENQFGNSAAYQLARLKRDHPEVVERVISGEFKSARAAMREVGLAPPLLTPVQKLVRQFQRLSPDEQQAFLDAINDINS